MLTDDGLREIADYARGLGAEKSLIIPRDADGRSLPRDRSRRARARGEPRRASVDVPRGELLSAGRTAPRRCQRAGLPAPARRSRRRAARLLRRRRRWRVQRFSRRARVAARGLRHPAQHVAVEDRALALRAGRFSTRCARLVVLDHQQMDFLGAEIFRRLPHVVARQRLARNRRCARRTAQIGPPQSCDGCSCGFTNM